MASNSLPITKERVSDEQEYRIRKAVRSVRSLPEGGDDVRPARLEDAEALAAFLAIPEVREPIYSLPKTITTSWAESFILDHIEHHARGEGLLLIRWNEHGDIVGYNDFQIWPQWGAGELAGALHPNLQSRGQGTKGIISRFDWMFDTLGLARICVTAALDNERTGRILTSLGFISCGIIESERPDGTLRPSKVWELSSEEWRDTKAVQR